MSRPACARTVDSLWRGSASATWVVPTTDIFQKRFAADGVPLSGEFRLSDPGPAGEYFSGYPDIGVDESDNRYRLLFIQAEADDRETEYRRDQDKELAKGRRAGGFVVVWRDPDASSLVVDLLSERDGGPGAADWHGICCLECRAAAISWRLAWRVLTMLLSSEITRRVPVPAACLSAGLLLVPLAGGAPGRFRGPDGAAGSLRRAARRAGDQRRRGRLGCHRPIGRGPRARAVRAAGGRQGRSHRVLLLRIDRGAGVCRCRRGDRERRRAGGGRAARRGGRARS